MWCCRRHLGPGHCAAGSRVWRLHGAEHQLQHAGRRRLAGRPAGAHRPPAHRPAAPGTHYLHAAVIKYPEDATKMQKRLESHHQSSSVCKGADTLQHCFCLYITCTATLQAVEIKMQSPALLHSGNELISTLACICRHTRSGTSAGRGCCQLLWRKCCARCCMRTPHSGSQHGSCCSTHGCKVTCSPGGSES